jgi:HlyD family secretion protein
MNEPDNASRRGPDGSRPGLSDRVRSLRLGGAAEAAPSRMRFLPWIVSFVLLLTSTAFAFRAYSVGTMPGQDGGRSADAGSASEKKFERPTGSATSVSSETEVVLQSKGYVIPLSLVQVSPKVGGQLEWINPDLIEGHPFEVGDVLAVIENTDYLADFDVARSAWRAARERRIEVELTLPEEVKQAEADLDETRQNSTQLKLDMERNRRLIAGNAATQRDMELAKYTYDATVARIRRLESSLRLVKTGRMETRIRTAIHEESQARATYDRARVRLEWTEVIAPVSGTILTKKAELGNIVNPSAFSSGISASLCDMADLRQLEIDMSIQERDIAAIKENQLCFVMPEAYEKDKEFLARHPRGYEGFVSRLMPTADRAKGAIPVRVRIKDIPKDESGKYLRPDMGALVSFMRGVTPAGK